MCQPMIASPIFNSYFYSKIGENRKIVTLGDILFEKLRENVNDSVA